MEREQDFDNEIEIDLKDLFLEIISYWQWIMRGFRCMSLNCMFLQYGDPDQRA